MMAKLVNYKWAYGDRGTPLVAIIGAYMDESHLFYRTIWLSYVVYPRSFLADDQRRV